MQQHDASNTIFQLAADFVNNTSRPVFLTGKAGTGKTTFLKYIKEHTGKNAVVVAPTGVAAINAGGVTMHSFFQLPFGPFIPVAQHGFSNNNDAADKHSLFKNARFSTDKRELMQELELLIIDEVSMVRADMLDAMDTILRHFRKKPHLPFGGVQVLYIGDLYQLPPVVPNNEWDILQQYYESPFFFNAKVIAEAPPLYIELKKIYRQNEQLFIDVLNRVRNNLVTKEDFDLLNNRYEPFFSPPAIDKYITLSTHNKKADSINANELAKLPGQSFLFTGTITGDFSDKALPTEMDLLLKEGAQVMFIKNDSGTERQYFNGKLATIKSIKADEIIVIANNDKEELKVEKETWRNIRYSYQKESDSIKEEELGSFTQYPIRLAWAITIHKSQGLTFDKAIIDAGASFAAGQVYVALSRCTSLNGMVLLSKIHPSAIATDNRVIAFAKKEAAAEELQRLLKQEQQQYLSAALIKVFDWKKVVAGLHEFEELVPGKKLPDAKAALSLSNTLLAKAMEQSAVAEKFQQQLRQLLKEVEQTGNTLVLEERASKAIGYFVNSIGEDLLRPLQEHIASLRYATKVRKYVKDVSAIEASLLQQLQKIIHTGYAGLVFCKDPEIYKQYEAGKAAPAGIKRNNKEKPVKGSSQSESLALFKKGKPIEEIANLRQLAETTVSGHLAMFVRTGELDVHELLTEEKIKHILPVVKELGGLAITPIKEKLSDDCSYADIRVVLNYWQWLQDEKVNP
jgi:uncharacterized protein YpbB